MMWCGVVQDRHDRSSWIPGQDATGNLAYNATPIESDWSCLPLIFHGLLLLMLYTRYCFFPRLCRYFRERGNAVS